MPVSLMKALYEAGQNIVFSLNLGVHAFLIVCDKNGKYVIKKKNASVAHKV